VGTGTCSPGSDAGITYRDVPQAGADTDMNGFKDHFSGHAGDYRAFRPTYPRELFAFLASLVPGRELAWDCGTGSGQAAAGLAEHFDRVFATDASAEQLANAEPHAKVEYAVAPAEKCPLPNASADLVMVAQALHWFDHDRFYAEVRRVCKPGGIFAATCYYLPSVNAAVDPILRQWEDFIRPYWTSERVWVDVGYRSIPFPFPELPWPRMEVTALVTLAQFVGYLSTWSASKQ
jgi:SAM-dependent methyltransferase